MHILVVEDNPKIAMSISKGLKEHGYAVTSVSTGREGEELAAIENFDLIILDLMLPDRHGVDVCRNMRQRGLEVPVLMLTALTDTEDKVEGLDAGADDYLGKPFEFSELHARCRALLRRGTASTSAILEAAGVRMDLPKRRVVRGSRMINLTAKEFALLEYLMRNPERVLSRGEIGDHVWDMNFDPFSNVIDVFISILRKKLEAEGEHRIIHTVVRAGYVLADKWPLDVDDLVDDEFLSRDGDGDGDGKQDGQASSDGKASSDGHASKDGDGDGDGEASDLQRKREAAAQRRGAKSSK